MTKKAPVFVLIATNGLQAITVKASQYPTSIGPTTSNGTLLVFDKDAEVYMNDLKIVLLHPEDSALRIVLSGQYSYAAVDPKSLES